MIRFLLLDKLTKNVIDPNVDYGTEENAAIWLTSVLQSIDPSIELVCEYIPFTYPAVDARIVNVQVTQEYFDEFHPVFTQVKQWRITYTTSLKSQEDIITVIEDIEDQSNNSLLPLQKQVKYIGLALDSLYKLLVDGTALKAKEQKIVDKFRKQMNKMWKNDDKNKEKIDQLIAGTTPNLDDGWELNAFNTEEE